MAGLGPARARLLRFGPFELDVRAGELRQHGIRIKLREQPIRILVMLLDHPGEVVLRDEIRLALWPNNTIVEFDHGINAAIQKLRDALGESAGRPRYVETVARRGYRFLGEVERVGETAAAVTAPEESESEAPARLASHYRILGKLGEGGMGVVYRAEDVKLGRQAALKFLPCEAGEAPEAIRQRFEREARAASALNHPNICTVYGLEEVDGQPAIAMELVEGETLAARLQKAPLPVAIALPLARQIADALSEAHRHGVIHRDLKPANIMLTGPRDRPSVKVLDFGLAKMERPASASAPGAETVTEHGALLGTLHYMSPEQAEGKEADARSDIFSFGLVLYEMIAGRKAFEAESRAGVIAAILEKEPPACEPEWLNRIVRACVAKDPEERFQSARDVKLALEWGGTGDRGRPAFPLTSPKWIAWAAAALVVCVAIPLSLRTGPASPQRPLALSILPPLGVELPPVGGDLTVPVISPDGSSVAFATRRGLWVRRLDSLEPSFIRGSEEIAGEPWWSADSQSLMFPTFMNGPLNLVRVRAPDGPLQILCPIHYGTRSGTEDQRGAVLFAYDNILATAPGQGGQPQAVAATQARFIPRELLHGDQGPPLISGLPPGRLNDPQFLPGSEDLLFLSAPFGGSPPGVYLATFRNGRLVNPVLLMRNDTAAHYTSAGGGRVLFVRNDNLYSQKLDRKERRLIGEAELFEQGVGSTPAFAVFRADFSVAESGAVAWRPGRAALNQVTIFDRHGKELGTAGSPDGLNFIAVSPDDSRVLAEGSGEAWLFTPGQPGRLALGNNESYRWKSDGLLVGEGGGKLIERAPDGSKNFKELGKVNRQFLDVSPDGKHVLVGSENVGIFTSAVDMPPGGSLQRLNAENEHAYAPTFSPDGKWIVYSVGYASGVSVYVQPYPGPGLRMQIASSEGISDGSAVWRGDGKEILIAGHRGIWSVRVDTAADRLHFSAPELLFSNIRWPSGYSSRSRPLAVSRDGSRIYFNQAVEQPNIKAIHVRMGWAK